MSTPPNNAGYLASLSSYSPWGSRSATPKPPGSSDTKDSDRTLNHQRGGDHTISLRHRLSLRKYPVDCPPLNVHWYHAVDMPKRKPQILGVPRADDKPAAVPRRYVPFSDRDSKAIEQAFQKLADQWDAKDKSKSTDGTNLAEPKADIGVSAEDQRDTKLRKSGTESDNALKVPVNEDFLFDVDIERRELAPVYWLGPVYDCRRGTWFIVEGTTLRPCDENLATQLEEGYLKLKPWKYPNSSGHQRSASQTAQPRSRPSSLRPGENPENTTKPRSGSGSYSLSHKGPQDQLDDKVTADADGSTESTIAQEAVQRTFRLFGAHMNSVVTYQDDTTAWILTEDFLTGMRGTMYERFAGGAHFAGVKVVRGYNDTSRKEVKDLKTAVGASPKVEKEVGQKATDSEETSEAADSSALNRRVTLERHMSSLVESGAFTSRESQEEEIRKRDEKEIQDDYKDTDEDDQGRDVEHLILVTHGIGQQLGLRFESVNFVHDVNTLRKTLKGVYNGSADLQALNAEVEKSTKNCRIQVLPICWRHLLDFPRQSLKHNRKEHDLGDTNGEEEEEYPSIDDITVNSIFRSLITDLALDILLYQSPAYKGHITRIVHDECNRIYQLFKARNPNFKGKVSLMGHSLGSAIMFDILCNQKIDAPTKRYSTSSKQPHRSDDGIRLDFDVEDFYALGSPIGLFQMLKGRTIAARQTPNIKPAQTPFDTLIDPFSSLTPGYVDLTTSAPKCERLYNIFHPTDPISYRLEPLISPAMAKLAPQALPYTKKGIFGTSGQGITNIGARVGQSVSGLWSSFSSGIASSLLNRSLGISADDASRMTAAQPTRAPVSIGAGNNIAGGGVISDAPMAPADAERLLKGDLAVKDGEHGIHPPTLLDGEIETLYSGFQKHKNDKVEASTNSNNPFDKDDERRELDEQAKKLKREEQKVRALNKNGRVDYSIQEGTFDLSLLAGIASHLSYWAEEDVSHFVISQLLSRGRVLKGDSQRAPSGQQPGSS